MCDICPTFAIRSAFALRRTSAQSNGKPRMRTRSVLAVRTRPAPQEQTVRMISSQLIKAPLTAWVPVKIGSAVYDSTSGTFSSLIASPSLCELPQTRTQPVTRWKASMASPFVTLSCLVLIDMATGTATMSRSTKMQTSNWCPCHEAMMCSKGYLFSSNERSIKSALMVIFFIINLNELKVELIYIKN